MRVIRKIALAAAAIWAIAGPPAAAQSGYEPQKVVYHINESGGEDGSGYKGALNNMRNHINAVGKTNLELRVVMHGNGLELVAKATDNQQLQGLIAGLKNDGVRFQVCNNTLTSRDIDPDADLFDVWPEDIVPSGVAELAKLQTEGFVYLKP
ncbi:DsrE family protein [Paracoccus salsus]|uniref:DsrE family protein n=1 Tax=Paracoccus salsus TaxID=2911061 RepID=UPI001F20FB4F|nr:DsrE family protein [Paracoccus salsus]MCF3972161.1 DsrE family protein [Paracoccus salsus]